MHQPPAAVEHLTRLQSQFAAMGLHLSPGAAAAVVMAALLAVVLTVAVYALRKYA